MAERCTVLCESNMRALLKDLCVSLRMVLFRNSQANRDICHIHTVWLQLTGSLKVYVL